MCRGGVSRRLASFGASQRSDGGACVVGETEGHFIVYRVQDGDLIYTALRSFQSSACLTDDESYLFERVRPACAPPLPVSQTHGRATSGSHGVAHGHALPLPKAPLSSPSEGGSERDDRSCRRRGGHAQRARRVVCAASHDHVPLREERSPHPHARDGTRIGDGEAHFAVVSHTTAHTHTHAHAHREWERDAHGEGRAMRVRRRPHRVAGGCVEDVAQHAACHARALHHRRGAVLRKVRLPELTVRLPVVPSIGGASPARGRLRISQLEKGRGEATQGPR